LASDSPVHLRHGGLRYAWHPIALLSRPEAEYGLARLWERVAGSAGWEGEPVLSIPAADRNAVLGMFELPPGKLPWVALRDVLPAKVDLGLDTDRLPALCPAVPGSPRFDRESSHFPLDLVTMCFLLLTRWEERNLSLPKDARNNTAEASALPSRQGFLHRPVLDEWALVLRAWFRALHPGWRAKPSDFRVLPTHDIDRFYRYPSARCLPRRVAGTVLRTKSLKQATVTALEGARSLGHPEADPGLRLVRELAARDEQLGVRGVFFFMTADRGPHDEGYDLTSTPAQRILEELRKQGHSVGWHPGYRAAEDRHAFFGEAERFRRVVGEDVAQVRMHFLRWRSHTLDWMQELGVASDHSWGLNDLMGFRCGTAIRFALWDGNSQGPSAVMETPLLVQDGAFAAAWRRDHDEAHRVVARIRARAKRVGGCFSFLVHNNPHYWEVDRRLVAQSLYGDNR